MSCTAALTPIGVWFPAAQEHALVMADATMHLQKYKNIWKQRKVLRKKIK